MSEPTTPSRPFYVIGGTLKPGEPSYVERRADAELFESLMAGELCYVLTARQMGKSSLMAKTAKRLEQAGVASAIVDLTQIGSERGAQAAGQWYFGIANVIHRQLGITVPLRPWWQERADLPPVQRLTDFFRELVLANRDGRVVVFVDEIDSTIGLPFADDFFAALRACFNARATEDSFERLTFVLLGVATPAQLIQDPARTPFNIGRRIDLADFSSDEAWKLASGLHADPGEADRRLEHILYWTGGHPYLTQALCRAVRERAAETGTAEEIVDLQVEDLFLSSSAQREETNLKHTRARLERPGPEGRRLLQLYRLVRQGKSVPDQPTSALVAQLKLAGVVKATDEVRLAVRNRIYAAVFTPAWAKSAMPADRGRQLAAATLAASLVGVLVWYAAFQPRPYEAALRTAIKEDAYNSAQRAYAALYANPFSRSRATELMQEFWEQRALRYAQVGERDESLLSCLQGLVLRNSERLKRQARNLVSADYESLKLTRRHKSPIWAAAFSPDGRALATTALEGNSQLWDVFTGRQILSLFHQGDADVSVAFSPDGRTITTGSSDGAVRLWDETSGQLLVLLMLRQGSVNAIAFSPDGRTLATGTEGFGSSTGQIWDARTGKPLSSPWLLGSGVRSLSFSPDGRILAAGLGIPGLSWGAVKLWDTRTGKLLDPHLRYDNVVSVVAFSRDGRTLVTGSSGGKAFLWDAVNGKPLAYPLKHNGAVRAVAFSSDGRTLATASEDGTARLWNVATGEPLAPFLREENSVVAAVAFSAGGRTLVTGSGNGTTRLWETVAITPLTLPLQYENSASVVALSDDGQALATGSLDGTARLWNAVTGKPLTPPLQHEKAVVGVALSPDGRTLATKSDDGALRLWDAADGKALASLPQYGAAVSSLAFNPRVPTLVTGSEDGTVRFWDSYTGKPLGLVLQQEDAVIEVAFSPDGKTLATGSTDGSARLWSVTTGKLLVAPLLHGTAVGALAFSPDGRTLVTGSFDGTVRLKSAITGKVLAPPFPSQGSVRTIAFNPKGKAFFVTTDHWLNTYSWDGKNARLLSSQLLHGLWKKGFRFPSDCDRCLQVALGDTSTSFHLETLRLDETLDPPIEGDPRKLLEEWQNRLGLTFDDQMKPVSAMDFQEAPPYGGSRSPKPRPKPQR